MLTSHFLILSLFHYSKIIEETQVLGKKKGLQCSEQSSIEPRSKGSKSQFEEREVPREVFQNTMNSSLGELLRNVATINQRNITSPVERNLTRID